MSKRLQVLIKFIYKLKRLQLYMLNFTLLCNTLCSDCKLDSKNIRINFIFVYEKQILFSTVINITNKDKKIY